MSLLPGQRLPDRVAVVLTSPDEARQISHPRILAVTEGWDRRSLAVAIDHALEAGRPDGEMIVGIDPGPRPGYAIFAGERCVGEGVLDSPEGAGPLAMHLRHRFPSSHVLFRVGLGDPPSRNRIVNSLLVHHRSVELVDERGTTPRGRRRPRDPAAARSIAHGVGRIVREPMPTTFTPGEIANLQRLSREGSDGLVTISRTSAHRVLRGEISLQDAVRETISRNGALRGPGGTPGVPAARRELL